ncbi:MAG: DUF5362 family protein [Candidatus Omnitrophota bacterium]
MVDIKTIKCEKCDGLMNSRYLGTGNKVVVFLLVAIGVLASLTVIGAIIGVPLVIFGLKIGSKKEYFWVCDKCKYKIKKHD